MNPFNELKDFKTMLVDEWVYSYRLYGHFGTYKIGYETTLELAYAKIGGVEYGDPNVDD